MAENRKITASDIYSGKDYRPSPGDRYEVAPDTWLTLREPVAELGREWDKQTSTIRNISAEEFDDPESDNYRLKVMIRRLNLCTVEAGDNVDLETVTGLKEGVMGRIVQDFLTVRSGTRNEQNASLGI